MKFSSTKLRHILPMLSDFSIRNYSLDTLKRNIDFSAMYLLNSLSVDILDSECYLFVNVSYVAIKSVNDDNTILIAFKGQFKNENV